MKKLIAIVVAAFLLLVAAPWGLGKMAEVRVNRNIDALLAAAPYVHLVDRQWTSGWFHSEQLATFELSIPGLDAMMRAAVPVQAQGATSAPRAAFRFQVRNEVLHGPILGLSGIGLARVNTHVLPGDERKRKITEIFGTDEPVRVSTRVGFFGGGTTTVTGDARKVSLSSIDKRQTTGTISWDAFRLSIGTSRGANAFDASARQPRIQIDEGEKGSTLLLADIDLDGSSKRIVGDLYDTDLKLGIGKLSVANAGTPAVEVDALRYTVDTSRDGDFLDYKVGFGSGEVRGETMKASGLQLRKSHYDFTMRHLHVDTLQKMMTAIRTSQARADGDPAVVMQAFKDYGVELLRHDPELVIDRLGIETREGDGLIKGTIRLEGVDEKDFTAGATSILQKIVADFSIEVARTLADKLPNGAQMTGAALDGGYAKLEGGKLVSHIEYRHGELTVNGKVQKVPLPGSGGAQPSQAPPPTRSPSNRI